MIKDTIFRMEAHSLLDKALKENKTMISKTETGSSSAGSSQSIVDELFKDFISNKFNNKSSKTKSAQSKAASRSSSVDEISKLLDMEISSIKAHTKEPQIFLEKESTVSSTPLLPRSNSVTCTSHQLSQLKSIQTKKDFATSHEMPANIPLPPQELFSYTSKSCHDNQNNADTKDSSSSCISSNVSLPTCSKTSCVSISVAESIGSQLPPSTSSNSKQAGLLGGKMKLNIPKQLGCKLSVESLSLIKSNDKIDKKGRVWEDGEVQSSHSEDSTKDDSDSDDDGLSETGSINSDKDWKSQSSSKHKKKRKHKHKKKKKKKSSKEKDKDTDTQDEKDGRKNRDRNKGSRVEKDESTKADRECSSSLKDKYNTDSSISSKTKEKGSDNESSSTKEDKGDKEIKRRDRERKRRHNRSRSGSPKKSKRSRSRSKSPRKSRRSSSPKRNRYDEWDARRYSDNSKRSRSRSSSRSPFKRRRSSERKRERSTERKRNRSTERIRGRSTERGRERSKERDRSKEAKREKQKDGEKDLRLQIDKAKLRKIAIANTLNTMKMGQPVPAHVDVAAVKSGGKSVEELTDFCKRISEKDHERQENAVSDSSEEEPAQSDEEDTLIHHPFKVKEATTNIVMNIRNAKQLPVLTPSEKQAQQAHLRLSFPVSSGSHHRANESEWVPVEKPTAPATSAISNGTCSQPASVTSPEPPKSIFPSSSQQNVDISTIISERLQAVRKLQQNPYDVQALSSMHKAQEKASQWAQSKFLPGQFTGSTGAQVMSQQEIIGDKRHQAWVKKTQFQTAAPVQGGIGMFLLQKMGWKQGEGLGKNQEGNVEPLQLDIKMDRRGLATAADNPRARPQQATRAPLAKDLSHKHPVSALMELCNKRRWHPPSFTVVSENGPAHKKCFLFKVKVNDVEYQPAVPSSNKKSAKAQCAAVCLQELGLLSKDAAMNY